MTHPKNIVLTLLLTVLFSLSAVANDDPLETYTQLETQTLELEAADVSALRLTAVENEADKNASEVHQESSVGRAGLQGACRCFPDGHGGFYCQ